MIWTNSAEKQTNWGRPSKMAMIVAAAALTVTAAGVGYSNPGWLPLRLVMADASPARPESVPTLVDKSNSARAPVPVGVVTPARKDVPVYAVGLGTVQASLTIGIHSQVDGKLEEVLFTEGQQVKKGDVLARIDSRLYKAALDQAKARRAQDVAQLISAQKDLERFNTLARNNFQSQQSIDQQVAKVDQLNASIESDDAQIEAAQTQLDYTSILAPSDGRVGVRLVDPGNIVHASDAGALATLVLMQPAAVMFTLPAQSLNAVRDAMARGSVIVRVFDQDNRAELSQGQLLLIDNAIDQATATIRLKAMFANAEGRLWPGQFVNARILIETRADALTIPPAAIQRGPQGLFVWLVSEDGVAEPRKVELGPANETEAIVTSGLTASDRVVVDGQYRLEVGARVNAAPLKLETGKPGDRT